MDDSINPLVSVVCTTYNHEAYIRQCLDGFIMQKTDFPFEIIVHDDASTDSTTEIISQYIKKCPFQIKTILQKENQFIVQKTGFRKRKIFGGIYLLKKHEGNI